MNELKRITTPFKYVKNIDYLYQDREKSNLIISCSNRKKNFYDTTKCTKWNEMLLASLSWRYNKSCGDHFTINPVSKLPAWSKVALMFNKMGLNSHLIYALNNLGIIRPTNIQSLTMPTIMEGNNVIIGGETGGGKTLAFVLPILNQLFGQSFQEEITAAPSSIIVAPTWELCDQLNKVIMSLCDDTNLKSVLFKHQEDLHEKINVLVSTPNCIVNGINSGKLLLKNLRSIVMDEADMLLDESFRNSIRLLLSKTSIQTCRPIDGESVGSQLILCNATFPEYIDDAFGQFVPIDSFSIIQSNDMQRLIPSVSHKFIRCSKEQKPALLISSLKKKGINSCPFTIIFCNTNISVINLSNILKENGVEHATLYKNMKIEERTHEFQRFQNGNVQVLLSTDLGSRGLDTIKAKHVINYEFPRIVSDYLHRAGRTGRVGSGTGKVTSYISSSVEVSTVQYIETSVRQNRSMGGVESKPTNKSLDYF